jgi:hypothetical protein
MSLNKRAEILKNIEKLQQKKQALKDKFLEQDQDLERRLQAELDRLSALLASQDSTLKKNVNEERKYNSLKDDVLPFVLQILEENSEPMSVKEISDVLKRKRGVLYQNISVIMKQLMKYDSTIQKVGRGTYTLRRKHV